MTNENELWVEKYRPKKFEDMIGQKQIVERVKAFVDNNNIMNMIFYGPAGVGKTTLATIIARTVYGDNWSGNFKEINASDESGIDVVRGQIKTFARSMPLSDVDFKIILLDECDSMCLEENTKVVVGTKDAYKILKIKDVPQHKYIGMPSFNIESKNIENDRGKCIDSGIVDLYEIETEDCRKILASASHPFFKYENDKIESVKLSEIKQGQEILDFLDSDKSIIRKCETCNRPMTNKRFCSVKCKDNGHSNDMSGENNSMFGKKHSKDTRCKMSETLIRLGCSAGDRNPSKRPEVKEMRRIQMTNQWRDETYRSDMYVKIKNSDYMKKLQKYGIDGTVKNPEYARKMRSSLYRECGLLRYNHGCNHRRFVEKLETVNCEMCGITLKTKNMGQRGVIVHHIDGNEYNNEKSNLKNVCTKCHNLKCHDAYNYFLKCGWDKLKSNKLKRPKNNDKVCNNETKNC